MTVATFVLIHGAGDVGWYWHLVEQELGQHGHDTLAPDLPCDDDSAGLDMTDGRVRGLRGRARGGDGTRVVPPERGQGQGDCDSADQAGQATADDR
jgi:hypothetical protein